MSRKTIQKIKILEYLKSVKTHPTAEEVYQAVKRDIPTITLATVYRNLNIMCREGKIIKLEINGEFHFDSDIQMHQHFVCKKCGKIEDIYRKKVSEYVMREFKSNDVEEIQIILYGTCKKCRSKLGGGLSEQK